MSKLAHSNQETMDEIEARHRDHHGEIFDMDDEASQFAAYLLIPEKFLKADLAKMKRHDIEDDSWVKDLAKRYRVSVGLMIYRLRLKSGDKS